MMLLGLTSFLVYYVYWGIGTVRASPACRVWRRLTDPETEGAIYHILVMRSRYSRPEAYEYDIITL
jgi:hypothetical protein